MFLIDKYVEAALKHIKAEQGRDFNAEEIKGWMADQFDTSEYHDERIGTTILAAHILNGDIRHCYEGGCPDENKGNAAPDYGCNDKGCVACLIQKDYLQEILGK